MAWTLSDDLDAFRAHAGGFLRARPDVNTTTLSVSSTLAALGIDVFGDRPPVFGWWHAADGEVAGAFLRTPPYPVALSAMPEEAAAALPAALAGRDPAPPGVNGPAAVAEVFAAAYRRVNGGDVRVLRRERLFRLGTLRPPQPAPAGRARTATAADRDLLVAWWAAFRRDAGLPSSGDGRMIDDRIGGGRLMLWETGPDPVAMAAMGAPAAGAARVGPVYTPKAQRGRGYGGAVTAALSQAALDAGAREVLLFTDLANPTSNALYQRLGYRPRGDYTSYAFAR
ncbi:GNAT family N-acetyltransferase [Streptomyces sp. RKND-216]|uniref:GNAT family N-acetyltransferase n=1 Tax=Streptomyces sp. RKND-216 TaxID=2562581 RepID=UPI00109DBA01|nr:GNAT family N-acetyltransferase [Streptomyces sp. RKND-216]THA25640.1 GNAT family N-acetyltransferase [Streptomyces sp. RKND-216]